MTTETPTTPFFPLSYPDAFPFSPLHSVPLTFQNTISPNSLGHLCMFDRTLSGKGIKIAFICAFGSKTLSNDLDVFLSTYSLPKANISLYFPLGIPSHHSPSWTAESALCSQWLCAFCPGAEIFGIISPTDNIFDLISCALYASGTLSADVICMSFGCPEFRGQSELCALLSLASSDSIFISASGNSKKNVFFPSTCASVLSVGESCVRTNSETGEKAGLEYACKSSSCGVSRYTKAPSHQIVFLGVTNSSDGFRVCPDFCMRLPSNAHPAIYISKKGFIKANGTSLCCVLASCLCAHLLEKSPPSFDGKESIARYFYTLSGGTGYDFSQRYFNDVTLGEGAKKGFDTATGLGSANCALICKG